MNRRRLRGLVLLLPPLVLLAAGCPPLIPCARGEPAIAVERYKTLLAANPVEGTALDRLWKLAEERNATGALLDEYRAAAPRSPAASLVLGHLLKRAGQLDPAAEAYRAAAVLDPASPLPSLALAALANARGDFAHAAEDFEAALPKLPPGDIRRTAETLLALGAARQAAGDPARAAEAWERAAALDPRDMALRERLATALESAGQPERAATHLEFVAANAPAPETRANALRALGNLHAARGDFDAARGALERGLALLAPGNWLRAEFTRARFALHARADRLPELETRLRADAERTPRDLGGWLALAEFYGRSADAPKERETLEKVLNLSPRAREPALRLARLLTDDPESAGEAGAARAASLLDGLLKAQPGNFDLVLARAELDLRLNHPEPAVARVEAARATRPADETLGAAALAFFTRHHLTAAAERELRGEVARLPTADEPAFALASFLFAQKNADAARETLRALLARSPVPERPARLARAAALCRAQNAPAEALAFSREAAALQPESAARALELGDAELAAGNLPAARAAFETAAARAPGETDRETAERKLFSTFAGDPAPPAEHPPVRPRPGVITGRADPATPPADPAAHAYLDRLETLAREQPTVENLLRLARWHAWRRAAPEALDAARRAVAAAPENVAAREALARLAADAGDRALAAETLNSLAKLDKDPAVRARHRRALGKLRLEEGNTADALAIFSELERANPGSREALGDLALAQQAADRWYDALITWERLYALPGLTPAARMEIRQPLLLALDRLGQHERALEILNAALEAQPDPAARQNLFRDTLAQAQKHGLLPQLALRAEARVAAARPGDVALLVELAALRRAQNREADADALLERAALAAPDSAAAAGPGGALSALVESAENRGDLETAIARQRRLVSLAGAGPEALAKLADLHVTAGDPAEAARVWNTLAARFPREPSTLVRAADFFEGADGDDLPRARELLARAVALDGTDLARQLRLAELAAAAGDVSTARAGWEFILTHTPVETPSDTLEPVDLAAAANPSTAGAVKPPPASLFTPPADGSTPRPLKEERRQRLTAIRGLSRLLANEPLDGPARRAWLERWGAAADAGAPGEALVAFVHAGANDRALDLLARRMGKQPAEVQLPRIFVNLALAARDAGRLHAWLRGDGEWTSEGARARREVALEALRQYLPTVAGEDRMDPALFSALFPADPGAAPREMLLQAATGIFAPQHRYAEAAMLAERALPLMLTGRAAVAVPLARWQLLLHEPARARETLRGVLEDPAPTAGPGGDPMADGGEDEDEMGLVGDGSDAGLEAVRLLHGLLPEAERASFRETFAARLQAGGHSPVRTALAGALLAGLAGDEPAARAALERLVALRPMLDPRNGLSLANGGNDLAMVGARRWNFLLAAGARFRSWRMEGLALALWRRAAAEVLPPGLPTALAVPGAAVGPEESARRDLLARLATLEFTVGAADPARTAALGDALARAARPVVSGVPPTATIVSLLLDNAERGRALALLADPGFRRGLAGAPPEFWRTWLRNLGTREGGNNVGVDPSALENLLRTLLRERAAAAVSGTAPVGGGVGLPRRELALALADCLETAGDPGAAGRVLENALGEVGPRETVLLVRLANFRERTGQAEDAARLLQGALRTEPGNVGTRLALAALEDRLGHPDEALRVLEEPGRLASGSPAPALPSPQLAIALGKRWVAAGQTERAVDLARRALRAGQGQTATEIAAGFADRAAPDERATGRRLLAAVVHGSRDPTVRFNAQTLRLEKFTGPSPGDLAAGGGDAGEVARELHRLGRLTESAPTLRPAFETVRFRLGTERKEGTGPLEADLRREWREGDVRAGGRLVALLLRGEVGEGGGNSVNKDADAARTRDAALSEIVGAFQRRPQLDEGVYGETVAALEAANRPALAANVAARLTARYPQSETATLLLARNRWRAGDPAGAETTLADWETANVGGDGAVAGRLAAQWRDLGEPRRAEEVLRRALARNPLGWQGNLRAALVKLELASPEARGGGIADRLPVLRASLRLAYADPACRDLEPALDYLDAAGRLETAAGAAADLGVPVGLRPRLVAGAFARLVAAGRGEAARRSVEARPVSLREAPVIVSTLRTRATEARDPAALASLAALGEQALTTGETPDPRLARELARVYDACRELAAAAASPEDNGGSAARNNVEWLRRACALEPANFERVRRLFDLLNSRGETAEATTALKNFLAAPDAAFETAPADREEAKRLLAARG